MYFGLLISSVSNASFNQILLIKEAFESEFQ